MLLNVHSHYSLRYGTLSLDDIIEGMLINGYDTAVLTDINNTSASLDFIRKCKGSFLKGLAGAEFRNGDQLLYIGIAKNENGFYELNELLTRTNRDDGKLPLIAPEFHHAFVIYPYGSIAVKALRDNEYIGIRPHEVNKIVLEPAANLERYVMLQTVSFTHEKEDVKNHTLHKQLRAIEHNILISQLEPGQYARKDETMIDKDAFLNSYRQFPQLIRNTEQLLAQCSFNFDYKESKNKKNFTGDRYEDNQRLYQYAMEGFTRRYHATDNIAKERIIKELEIIDNQNFSSYFLITHDICQFARHKNFHYVGRGSGANSVVAYCLGITDVDPIELNLYFERFLNPKRKTPPDFDIDFCWNERDEVYNYIFHRYPEGHVALMGTMTTFQDKAFLRELGKVYGLPKAEIDRLVEDPDHMLNKNEITKTIRDVNKQMADFPNQRSIHASGILISELPLTCYSALDYPPKGLPTTQYDMYTAEAIGFEKFDILSQRGIGHIRDCRELVKRNRGEVVETSNPRRFFKDPKIAAQLREANTVGCFYIESPAMRQLITKLRCDNYLTLVAASSIIRPGVASSGMMKAYIERHRDPDKVEYLHPAFKEQLEDTYGIMVYQEDVMKIGHYFGGLDMADADVLRRMMSGKYRDKNQLWELGRKYFTNCREKGYPEEVAREIWRQMESFAGFSFNKAHSASYAVESYQSLYLKTYYPLEFMVAVLNNYGGFYNRKVYVNEARKAGGNIYLPCINKSIYNTTIYGKDVYLGFDGLLNLEATLARRIPEERLRNGPYTGIENFVLRTGAGLEQVIILIRCGAFRFTGIGKKELLWEAHLLLAAVKYNQAKANIPLFENQAPKPVLPHLESSILEDLYDEIELMGFCVSGTHFDLARSAYRGDVCARELPNFEGQTIRIVGDMIADKTTWTRKNDKMKFGTFFDVHGDFFDTVHFNPTLKQYPLRGTGLYLIEGKVLMDFGCPSIEVYKCGKIPLKNDPRSE